MSEFKKIGDYQIPTYAVCYLEYGDSSGISDEDEKNIDKWLESEFEGFHSLTFNYSRDEDGDTHDPHFTSSPPFGLACDVQDCEVWGHTKES